MSTFAALDPGVAISIVVETEPLAPGLGIFSGARPDVRGQALQPVRPRGILLAVDRIDYTEQW